MQGLIEWMWQQVGGLTAGRGGEINDRRGGRSGRVMTVYSRCSVEIEATFVLDVEHQVASIQVLHYKEEVLLYEKHITVSVADK